MRRISLGLALLAAFSLQPYTALAGDGMVCVAENGVEYDPAEIFDPAFECYRRTREECPPQNSICANHALVKLGDYDALSHQDLLYSAHRGLWGQTYGASGYATPPGQNTIDAFRLIHWFNWNRENIQGRDYGDFLRGRLVELDMTTNGDTSQAAPGVVVDHYVTTANTARGDLNTYLVDVTDAELGRLSSHMLENRDFSASGMALSQTPVATVTEAAIREYHDVDFENVRTGLIAFHDIKARRGDIQCQVFELTPSDPAFDRHRCRFSAPDVAAALQFEAEVRSAEAMSAALGAVNTVVKTTATFDQMVAAYQRVLDLPRDAAIARMRTVMWQPHPKGPRIEGHVQYVHDWLRNIPRSVAAWETNIFFLEDETNRAFCIASYRPDEGAYGRITTRYVSSMSDTADCIHGPYMNILDYFRQETGNAAYFGFTEAERSQKLISGNRANLWLLETASAIGTADREYRWQMLGSDPTYNMSDIIRYLSYPYVAYQILNADRLDVVYQAITGGMYPRYGPNRVVEGILTTSPRETELSPAARLAARDAAEARWEEEH